MSALIKFVVVPVLGIGGTAGTVYMGSQLVNFSEVSVEDDSVIETIKDKFAGRLITSKSTDPKGKVRLKKLEGAKQEELEEGLKKVKNEQDLKSGCDDVVIKPFESDTDSKVRGVQEYCSFYIRDQILRRQKLLEGEDTWEEANKRLKEYSKGKLSKDMEGVKQKLEKENDALKSWCTSKYDSLFKDKRDQLLVDVSDFCTAVPKPKNVPASDTTSDLTSPPSR